MYFKFSDPNIAAHSLLERLSAASFPMSAEMKTLSWPSESSEMNKFLLESVLPADAFSIFIQSVRFHYFFQKLKNRFVFAALRHQNNCSFGT